MSMLGFAEREQENTHYKLSLYRRSHSVRSRNRRCRILLQVLRAGGVLVTLRAAPYADISTGRRVHRSHSGRVDSTLCQYWISCSGGHRKISTIRYT
eukprot:709031-Rhodomonas_salina.2